MSTSGYEKNTFISVQLEQSAVKNLEIKLRYPVNNKLGDSGNNFFLNKNNTNLVTTLGVSLRWLIINLLNFNTIICSQTAKSFAVDLHAAFFFQNSCILNIKQVQRTCLTT